MLGNNSVTKNFVDSSSYQYTFGIFNWHTQIHVPQYVSRVPKGADTFQSLITKNYITYESFFRIITTSIKYHFFNIFGKTVNLNFNESTAPPIRAP